MSWLSLILPLVGVVIGGAIGLASPFVSNRLERKKRKDQLVIELSTTNYELHNYTKQLFQIHFFHTYYNSRASLYHSLAFKATIPKEFEIYDRLSKDDILIAEKLESNVQRTFDTLVGLESKLTGLLVEIHDYYGKDMYKSINTLIGPVIRKGNDSTYLNKIDYSKYTLEDYKNLHEKLNEIVIKKGFEIQEECDQISKEIFAVLKN